MSDIAVQEVLQRVDALAAKLGVTAEYLWGVLVKQAQIDAWRDLALAVLFLVVISIYCAKFKSWLEWYEKSPAFSSEEDYAATLLWIGGLLSLFLTFSTVVCVYGSVGRLINPEFYAFESLMRLTGVR